MENKRIVKIIIVIIITIAFAVTFGKTYSKYVLTKHFETTFSSLPFYFEVTSSNEYVSTKNPFELTLKNYEENNYDYYDVDYEISLVDNDEFLLNGQEKITGTISGGSKKDEKVTLTLSMISEATDVSKVKIRIKTIKPYSKVIDLDFDFKPVHKITYEGFSFDTSSYPQEIIDGDELNIKLSGNIVVSNSNGNLIEGEDYTYINNQLIIPSVTTDIEIKRVRIKTGTYIAYTPDDNGSFITTMDQNGMMDQEFTQDKTIGWRIWDMDDEKITLISSEVPYLDDYYSYLTLFGADGYNNAVKILNSMAEKLYSNESLGAKARSIDMDDIDKVSTFDKETFVDEFNNHYGMEFKINDAYYPNIYINVPETYIDGVSTHGTLDRSNQGEWYFGEHLANELRGLYTYYTYATEQYIEEPYASMLNFGEEEADYWIASRCVMYGYGSSSASFSIFWMEYDGNIGPALLHSSSGDDMPYFGPIRPMVEIPLSGLTIGAEGDGTIDNPYSISKN